MFWMWLVGKKRRKEAPVPSVPAVPERPQENQPSDLKRELCFVCNKRLIPSGGIQYRCPDCRWL